MAFSTSLNSIVRALSAPYYSDLAKHGANHLNDTGKTLVYCLTLGLALLYEYLNADNLENKAQELDVINARILKKLDLYFCPLAQKRCPSTFTLTCTMNKQQEDLAFEQVGNGVEIRFKNRDLPSVAIPNITFFQLHQKLTDAFNRADPVRVYDYSDIAYEEREVDVLEEDSDGFVMLDLTKPGLL